MKEGTWKIQKRIVTQTRVKTWAVHKSVGAIQGNHGSLRSVGIRGSVQARAEPGKVEEWANINEMLGRSC